MGSVEFLHTMMQTKLGNFMPIFQKTMPSVFLMIKNYLTHMDQMIGRILALVQ